ncbi:hypothetical protein JD844_005745 [Phrynosoma platyrhinos]|uniref:Phospholipase A2 inhibitor N-terminal domain-containing protein n=1 Tax=Phrynosoma platyrhinos TaxID=52577 RepID=A0ABQ7TNN3_PHRPL|nr:hypothetical protein JD844_005745 [Phrynosoma platyrhinos]
MSAPGAGLQCETCSAMGDTCSGSMATCPSNTDACMSMVAANKMGGVEMKITVKSCFMMSQCRKFEGDMGKTVTSQVMGIQVGALIKDVQCNKAPICSASLLLILSGLLLMKFLF